ncbi:zinc transporter ZupT [Candidatus Woesearchaeota archaeon]|nr:zinc transporter ZupT [Candidatus Woesearchaeota archaeon]
MDLLFVAFGLTLLAGLSTGIGSTLAFFTKHTNRQLLSVGLGFSAGVMVYLSFVEILPEANEALIAEMGGISGQWIAALSFFAGIFIVAVIDRLIPYFENPHEAHKVEEMSKCELHPKQKKLYRIGLLTAVVIAVHNFPEGLVTFAGAMQDLTLGISLAIAIAIHNIPEGISISIPIFCATGSRKKAFVYSLLSGFAEPLGAVICYFVLYSLLNGAVLGIMLAGVAGIMVFISLDQLLPAAREYGEHHLAIYGLLSGMAVMAVSLILFV